MERREAKTENRDKDGAKIEPIIYNSKHQVDLLGNAIYF